MCVRQVVETVTPTANIQQVFLNLFVLLKSKGVGGSSENTVMLFYFHVTVHRNINFFFLFLCSWYRASLKYRISK